MLHATSFRIAGPSPGRALQALLPVCSHQAHRLGIKAVNLLPPVLFIAAICYPSSPQSWLERNIILSMQIEMHILIRKLSQWNEDQAEKFGDDWIKQLDYKVHSRSHIMKNNKWQQTGQCIQGFWPCQCLRQSVCFQVVLQPPFQEFCSFISLHGMTLSILRLEKKPKPTQHSGIPP